MAVSAKGIDDPLCLIYSSNTTCKTLSYPITHGFESVCLYGVIYNTSESVEVFDTENTYGMNIFCIECLLKDNDIILSCKNGKLCTISLWNLRMKGGTVRLYNISTTFRNVLLHEMFIQDYSSIYRSGYNELYFYNASLSCDLVPENVCGLYLGDIRSTKVVIVSSNLYNFKIDISVGQLILIIHDANITLPIFNIRVESFEYYIVSAFVQFEKVVAFRSIDSMYENENNAREKRKVGSESESDYLIILDVANPRIIIRQSQFTGVHLEIKSRLGQLKPAFFVLLLERNIFISTKHVGNGGALAVISQIKKSNVTVVECVFSNNSAVKGTSSVRGQGGGLYVEAKSLVLTMKDSIFSSNKATDLGTALYTTEGTIISIINCSFLDIIEPRASIHQAIIFLDGKVVDFDGVLQVSHPQPQLYVGRFDIYYFRLGSNLNIEIYCPKWYNHVMEYTSVHMGSKALTNVNYMCSPCNDNYYSTVLPNNTISYDGKANISHLEKWIRGQGKGNCIKCPYGALCTGNNMQPRPNYWAYWYEGVLVFQQCPAGYCCSSSDKTICNVYNYCSANRTGALCGACQEGFSVSILTWTCIPDGQCGRDQWFWIVVTLAAIAYALWYTMKDDIFALFFKSLTFIKQTKS